MSQQKRLIFLTLLLILGSSNTTRSNHHYLDPMVGTVITATYCIPLCIASLFGLIKATKAYHKHTILEKQKKISYCTLTISTISDGLFRWQNKKIKSTVFSGTTPLETIELAKKWLIQLDQKTFLLIEPSITFNNNRTYYLESWNMHSNHIHTFDKKCTSPLFFIEEHHYISYPVQIFLWGIFSIATGIAAKLVWNKTWYTPIT